MGWKLPHQVPLFLITLLTAAAAGSAPGEEAADRSLGLAPELRAVVAERPSHQRFIWTAQQAVSRVLEGKPFPATWEAMQREGFRLERRSASDKEESYSVSLPDLSHSQPTNKNLAFALRFDVPRLPDAASTGRQIRSVEVRLEDAADLPYNRLRKGGRYPKGSLLDTFFRKVRPPEARRYPVVKNVSLSVRGPGFYLSEEGLPNDYRPCLYDISLELVHKDPDRQGFILFSYNSANGLEPPRNRAGKPRPGPFSPADTFGLFRRMEGQVEGGE